jgi:hypothetical protein
VRERESEGDDDTKKRSWQAPGGSTFVIEFIFASALANSGLQVAFKGPIWQPLR